MTMYDDDIINKIKNTFEPSILKFASQPQDECIKTIKDICDKHNKFIEILDMNKTMIIFHKSEFMGSSFSRLDNNNIPLHYQWFLHQVFNL